jgi:LCP family protein required for cell wall assembly
MNPDFDDSTRTGIWKRLLLGAALVVFATAGATSVAAFREVDKVVNALKDQESLDLGPGGVAETDPGKPQTIMLLGSDRRPDNATDGGAGTGARSDTIILVRLDPDKNATALMSLPRDLKVEIPGHGVDKINAAYDYGGPKLTLRTVKRLTGLPINHVINVDFEGFRQAVDAIGCIYADIDRRYFNDTPGYAYINVQPGYQKLCGQKALEYARFRHEDSDLVRSARQQDLLREAKQQIGVGKLVADRDKLIQIFGKNTTSDSALKTRAGIIRLLKLAVFSVDQPVREVPFEGAKITSGDESAGVPSYVQASDATVKKLIQRFLGIQETPGPRGELRPKGRRKSTQRPGADPDGGLEKAPAEGADQALQAVQQGAGKELPVYYPTVRVKNSLFIGPPRYYKIKTTEVRRRKSYRMIAKRHLVGEYYGIQGTTWRHPPILESQSEKRRFGGRTFELHYDGDRLRIVAWRTPKAVYWVSNTLLRTLSERQMLAIARSTRLP